ncbi:TPA: helix-turn-helix domain-containing protein, partial [Enterococcus faecium]
VTLEYMDYQQASEYLGVSVGTIRKYVSQYGLPVIKIDTVIRFKKSDIDSFMEQYKG